VLPVVLGLLITAAFGARTWTRNADWRDEETLWSAALRTSPLSFKTHTGLAQALHAEHFNPEAVILENERSAAILDRLPDLLNTPSVYLRTGAQYISWAYSFQKKDQAGKTVTPPESISKFRRAKILLLRAVSILNAQHEADREKGLRGDPELSSTVVDVGVYLMLSDAEQGLGNLEESLRWAREAQDVKPMRAEVYDRIHEVLRAAGRRDEAMAALMQGVLLTSDPGLQRRLVAEYADAPEEGKCAISYAEAAPAINSSCGIVRKLACSVSGEVVRLGLKAGGRDRAARLGNELAAKYGCP
jgi:tetratricopeptide (TPR) repeat protein